MAMETSAPLLITGMMIQELENQRRNYEQVISLLAFKNKQKINSEIMWNLECWDRMIHYLRMKDGISALREYESLSIEEMKERISFELICALKYPNTIIEIA